MLSVHAAAVAGHQARIAAHLAAQLRHPPARTGVDIRLSGVAQPLKLETTRSIRVAVNTIRDVASPLERLAPGKLMPRMRMHPSWPKAYERIREHQQQSVALCGRGAFHQKWHARHAVDRELARHIYKPRLRSQRH
jgi:hypothetical protein